MINGFSNGLSILRCFRKFLVQSKGAEEKSPTEKTMGLSLREKTEDMNPLRHDDIITHFCQNG